MKKWLIFTFSSLFFISCAKENTNNEVISLTNQNVVLASGVSFKDDKKPLEKNEFVVINPFDGTVVKPCGNTIVLENNKKSNTKSYQSEKPCNNEIIEPSPELLNALRSNKPINGFVIRDGEKTPAVFYIGVTALYLGSHCNTLYLSGYAYTKCNKKGHGDAF